MSQEELGERVSRGDRVGESLVSALGVAEEEVVPLLVPAGPVGVFVKVPPLLGVSLGTGGVERVVDGEREMRGEVEEVAVKEGDLEVRVDGVKLGEKDAIAGSVADPENEEDGVASPDCVEEKEENRLGVSAEGKPADWFLPWGSREGQWWGWWWAVQWLWGYSGRG